MIYLIKTINQNNDSCLDKDCYLEKYGCHFNKKLCEFALSHMNHSNNNSNLSLEEVIDLTQNYSSLLSYKYPYDLLYIANMGYHDYYGSCINDKAHLALYIKDVITDEDGYDGIAFCRWNADMKAKLINIDWSLMI